jgi:DNA-binding response OmpR family regulator
MANILHFADAALQQPLSKLLRDAGHRLIAPPELVDLLTLHCSRFDAILLDWKSNCDQLILRAANHAGIPVVVISSRVPEAFWADDALADVYLEKPVEAKDIVGALIEVINDDRHCAPQGPSHWSQGHMLPKPPLAEPQKGSVRRGIVLRPT